MTGSGLDSDDEVEVLDLTASVPPAPSCRPDRASTAAAGTGLSPSPVRPPARERNGAGIMGGGRDAMGEESSSNSDDDLFSMDFLPLADRLHRSAATTATARRAKISCAPERVTAVPSPTTSGSRALPPAARAAAAASCASRCTLGNIASSVDCLSDSEGEHGDDYERSKGSGKGKGRDSGAAGAAGDLGSGAGSEAGTAVERCLAGDNNTTVDRKLGEDFATFRHKSDVVDLLSDSDGEANATADGIALGRSPLGKGERRRPAASAAVRDAARAYYDTDSDSSDGISRGRAGSVAGTSSDIDLDSLVLASQTSRTGISSPSAGSLGAPRGTGRRAASRGIGEEAEAASNREDSNGERGGSGGGGRAADFSESGVIDFGLVDDSSDDDFSITKTTCTGDQTSFRVASQQPRSANGGGGTSAVEARQEKALARKEATANRKRQREAAKQQRAQERVAVRHEKALAKEAEKARKAAEQKRRMQASGRFSHEEVACVMEQRFFDSPQSASARAGAAEQPDRDKKFMVVAGECGAPGAIWWTRRAFLEGGAAASGPGVQTLDILLVVVKAETLLWRLTPAGRGGGSVGATVDGNVFPELGRFVDGVRRSAPGFSRLVFVLEGVKGELDRQWNESETSGKGTACCTRDEFEDAQSWLLIHKEVETRLTKDGEETGQYLWDLTKALSELPYKDDVTELHCVPRSKVEARGSELFGKEEKELMDTWVKMLRQIRGVSDSRAVEIGSHYPLPRDLVAALSDPSVPESERASLLANKMGCSRTHGKIARRIFDLFTQEDGDFVLN